MNTIKKIGLATSLLCASSFANAAVYELGNATYNPDNYYNPDGFSSYEDLDHEIIFNDEGDDYEILKVKTFGSEFYSRLSVSGKFSDTFTFSLSKDSELSADVYASPDPVDFSLIQIDGFNATLYEYENIVDEFGNDIVYYSFDADGNFQNYYDDYRDYQFNITTSTGNWPDLTFEEYLVEQRGYFAITNTSSARLDPITLSAGTYSLIVEGEAYAPSDYSIRITSITSVTTTLITPVPEPSSIALMLGGLGLVGFMAARRKKT